MKTALAFLMALKLTASINAQNVKYRGRVLDRASMAPVVGATVRSGSLSVLTDSEGRFILSGNATGARPAQRGAPLVMFEGRSLLLDNRLAGRSLRVELLDAGGQRLSSTFHELAAAGLQRVELVPKNIDFVGFARLTLGGHIRLGRIVSMAGVVRTSLMEVDIKPADAIGTRTSSESGTIERGEGAGQAKRTVVAPEVAVSMPKLLTKNLSPIANDADLGDIVLDYPPRRLGVGVGAPYGAQMLFPAEGDSASARAHFEALWIHKMNTWRQSQGLGTTPLLWKVRPDPESTPGNYMPSLLPCCKQRDGSPGWGYDDIVTRKTYRDYQLHLEFNMMGLDDGNADSFGYCNSGVYITSSLEIQIETPKANPSTYDRLHGLATLINQRLPDREMYPGPGKWQAYDITWRAPRNGGPGKVTLYWNGEMAHDNQNWGSGSGSPVGLQLQNELGSDVRFRNIWLKELDITEPQTNFGY